MAYLTLLHNLLLRARPKQKRSRYTLNIIISFIFLNGCFSLVYAQKYEIAVLPFTDYSVFKLFEGKKSIKVTVENIPKIIMDELENYKIKTVTLKTTELNKALEKLEKESTGIRTIKDDYRQVGKQLGVKAVIYGEFTKIKDKVQISSRMINVETGDQITFPETHGTKDELDLLKKSLAKTIISKLREFPISPKPPSKYQFYYTIQVNAFTNEDFAKNHLYELRQKGFPAYKSDPYYVNDKLYYAVRVGGFQSDSYSYAHDCSNLLKQEPSITVTKILEKEKKDIPLDIVLETKRWIERVNLR